ncbi:unnamed protein product [Closterium sp. NIES-64]|nr:unnamed protein product [Closterium sp. NIES-64]
MILILMLFSLLCTSEAAALGASASVLSGAGESALSGTVSASASHTFTLDSGASRSFFRDRTTLTPLSRPVAVSLADPSGGPVLSRFSTVLPCPAAPSGTLTGLSLPSFSTNLVSGADLQDAGVHQFTPARQRVTHCTEADTGRHLATFYTSARVEPRAAPHSSQFPPTEAPLQTLHMDVWGPARVRGQGQERYFLLVVDDYSRYTTVFPLRKQGHPSDLHASGLTTAEWIAERRIGMVMDVARTSMMHAAAPHFSVAVCGRYAAHQINLHPRVSRPENLPSPAVDGEGWRCVVPGRSGSGDLGRLFATVCGQAVPSCFSCVFLGFPPDAPGWQFYHPTSRRVLSSQDVTSPPGSPPSPLRVLPLQVCPGRRGRACRGHCDSGAAAGAGPGGAEPGGAGPGGAEPGGAEPEGAEPGGAEPGGAEPGGAEPGGAVPGGAEPGGAVPGGASSRREPLSPQELREWFARRWRCAAGAGGSSAAEGTAASRPGGARTVGAGAAGSESSPGAGATEGVGAEPAVGGPTDSAPGAAAGGSGAPGGAAGGAAGVGTPAGAAVLSCCFWCRRAAPTLLRSATAAGSWSSASSSSSLRGSAACPGEAAAGSPPVFKARYVARGFSQRQGVDYFQTFSPTPKMTTLRVLLHVAAHRDYELHSLDFSTAFLQGSLHEEIWLRRPPGFTGSFLLVPSGVSGVQSTVSARRHVSGTTH